MTEKTFTRSMKKIKAKYEVIEVNNAEITVDVSLLAKTDELFFNATQMAKPFGRKPDNYLKSESAQKYIEALCSRFPEWGNDFVRVKRGGKYQGTWMHRKLALDFARWLDPMFAVRMDEWVFEKLKVEQSRKIARMEAKTGYLPMTNAILLQHDPANHYHFSNEADLLNRIVLGVSAKQFKKEYGVDKVRDACTVNQLKTLERFQRINTGLIEIGMEYKERKSRLIGLYEKEERLLE